MAQFRSPLRRLMTGRVLGWRASRALSAAAPALMRRLHFYGSGMSVEAAARRLLWRDETLVETPLTPEQERFIATRCRHDGGRSPDYWRAPWRFVDEYFEIEAVWLNGHTGRLADRDRRAVITEDGAPQNWNGDKVGALRRATPVTDAIALPVRRFNNYFHFMAECALPLTGYLGGPGRAPGRHVILAVEPRPFARAALAALAEAFDAELRVMARREIVFCDAAVEMRRARPAADWYPVTRARADALKAAIGGADPGEAGAPAPSRLFLKRGRARLRNIGNQEALDALLAERGYDGFEPSGDALGEQARRFDAAREIVAAHGAGLANMLFARPGARLVEIHTADFCKSVYLALCHMLGLEHVVSVGSVGDANQNFSVDLEDLAAQLPPA